MHNHNPSNRPSLLMTVYFIYFFCGMAMCFEGAFNPEFKDYFQLGYQQQMYMTFAKNIPFLLAVPIGFLIHRIGYKHCMTIAMLLFAAGTFLLVPGLQSGSYGLILTAFLVIGIGFNFELVAGNPLLSGLGPAGGSSSRLNLGNALGAVAQIIAPLILSFLIPATVVSIDGKLPYMKGLFMAIAAVLVLVAAVTWLAQDVDLAGRFRSDAAASGSAKVRLWSHPKVVFGFVTIFLVLGAEAGLFNLYRNFLEDTTIAGLTSQQSQRMFTVYFAVFAVGRLAGSWVQKRIKPAVTLVVCAVVAMVLLVPIMTAGGWVAVGSITLLGLFVSIFFPTLYSLAIAGLGDRTAHASGLLTMGFLGCALLPILQGRVADRIGLQPSFALCIVPYVAVLLYALKGHRLKHEDNA